MQIFSFLGRLDRFLTVRVNLIVVTSSGCWLVLIRLKDVGAVTELVKTYECLRLERAASYSTVVGSIGTPRKFL